MVKRHPLLSASIAVAGFASGAAVAFFLGGPAVLADGSDAERAWTVVAATAATVLLAGGLGLLSRSLLGGLAAAAGALPVLALLMAAEPDAWPVGAALLAGIAGGVAVGTVAGIRVRSRRAQP